MYLFFIRFKLQLEIYLFVLWLLRPRLAKFPAAYKTAGTETGDVTIPCIKHK